MTIRHPLAAAILAAATIGACNPKADTAKPDGMTACTADAKVCDDGSSVSRTGPNCEFPACPGEEVTEPASADGDEDMVTDETPTDEATEPAAEEAADAE
ncbi:MAG: hypothetical protein AAF799_08525 [Myxococcota bacterium]